MTNDEEAARELRMRLLSLEVEHDVDLYRRVKADNEYYATKARLLAALDRALSAIACDEKETTS